MPSAQALAWRAEMKARQTDDLLDDRVPKCLGWTRHPDYWKNSLYPDLECCLYLGHTGPCRYVPPEPR